MRSGVELSASPGRTEATGNKNQLHRRAIQLLFVFGVSTRSRTVREFPTLREYHSQADQAVQLPHISQWDFIRPQLCPFVELLSSSSSEEPRPAGVIYRGFVP